MSQDLSSGIFRVQTERQVWNLDGTAFCIAPDLLLTAAHVIWQPDETTNEVFVRSSGSDALVPARKAIHPSYTASAPQEFDFAILQLPDGTTKGSFEFPLLPADDAFLSNYAEHVYPLHLAGFPFAPPNDLYVCSGPVTAYGPGFIKYRMLTKDGQSGGPVYSQSESAVLTVAVHRHGADPNGDPGGPRITTDLLSWINETTGIDLNSTAHANARRARRQPSRPKTTLHPAPKLKGANVILKHGAGPKIACIDRSTVDKGVDFDKLIPALQTFVDECFAPVWGSPAKLVRARQPKAGHWTMTFFDSPKEVDEGYHDIALHGLPLAKIFVQSTLKQGDNVGTTACHELAEMLIDPACNLWAEGPKGIYAYEMCDAVEEEEFLIEGIPMSDFVFPAYFESFHKPNSVQFDFLRRIGRPFQILPDGYSTLRVGSRTKDIFGSISKKRRFAQEDRTFHRSEYRKIQLKFAR